MSAFVRLRADPLPQNQELTMAILEDVLGTAGRGAKNRIWALGRRRRGKLGTDLSSIGVSIGRFVAAALICTGAVLMMSGAASANLDPQTWERLTATSSDPVFVEYEIQPADVKGPFNKTIPPSLEKKAELKTLNFTGPPELLAEKFHIDPGLLTRLNPKASLETAGTKIMVPNVAKKPSEAKVAKVVVDKSQRTVRALGGDGKLISFYPASVGSEERPAPSGTLPIRSVVENPTYHYTPKLHFKGVKTKKPFTIAAGPNNPVGSTWIDLGDGYGIHGTPEPQNIGKTESHGCVRLTNWDAQALAKTVRKGIKVDFIN